MKVWAMRLVTLILMSALSFLEVIWMIFLLFPTMRELAVVVVWAPVCVGSYEVTTRPVFAHIGAIAKDLRLASKVLPIMCINTKLPIVIIFFIRTPNSLKVKDIKVHVRDEFLYHFNT